MNQVTEFAFEVVGIVFMKLSFLLCTEILFTILAVYCVTYQFCLIREVSATFVAIVPMIFMKNLDDVGPFTIVAARFLVILIAVLPIVKYR